MADRFPARILISGLLIGSLVLGACGVVLSQPELELRRQYQALLDERQADLDERQDEIARLRGRVAGLQRASVNAQSAGAERLAVLQDRVSEGRALSEALRDLSR